MLSTAPDAAFFTASMAKTGEVEATEDTCNYGIIIGPAHEV